MFNDADRKKYPLPAKPQSKRSLEDYANEVVDIRDILAAMGRWAPSGTFYSYKIDCPWSHEHSDGGLDKNCRLFGSTNIYCWAMHGYITPVKLYAQWQRIPFEDAARQLLDERGLLHKPWREKWSDLMEYRDKKNTFILGSKNDVVSALHVVLDTYPEYKDNEFSEAVRNKWTEVLFALDRLWELEDLDYNMVDIFYMRSLTALKKCANITATGSE